MDDYYNEVRKTLYIILILNIIIASIKIGYGWYSNILSISADGYDSLLDAVANIVAVIAIIIASRPVNKKHPYGYDKLETFASILVGLSLMVVSYEIIISALDKFSHPGSIEVSMISFIIMIATLIINIGLSRYEKRRGEQLKSDLLLADSQHTKSDVLATSIVILGLIFMRMGISIVDPILSVIIALIIIKTGISILNNNFQILLDRNIIPTTDICSLLEKKTEIINIHNVRTRGTKSCVYMDMHVIVDDEMSIKKAHTLTEECEKIITEKYPEVKEVLIHLESHEGLKDKVIYE